MSGSLIITGLMVFFSATTVAVILYPIIRLAPSWLDRSVNKKVVLHRAAAAALGTAMERSHNDRAHFDRLTAQHDYHLAALAVLAPDESVAPAPARRKVDAAA